MRLRHTLFVSFIFLLFLSPAKAADWGGAAGYTGPGTLDNLPCQLSNQFITATFIESAQYGVQLHSLNKGISKTQLFTEAPLFRLQVSFLASQCFTKDRLFFTPTDVTVHTFRDPSDQSDVIHFFFPTVVDIPGTDPDTVTVYVLIEARLQDHSDEILWWAAMDEASAHQIPQVGWEYFSEALYWPILRLDEQQTQPQKPLFVTGANGGMRIHDPFHKFSPKNDDRYVFTHPGIQQLAMMAYVDETKGYGTYVDVKEDKTRPATKIFMVQNEGDDLEFNVGAYPNTLPEDYVWSAPFRTACTLLDVGEHSWHDVAMRYKESEPVQELLAQNSRRGEHQALNNHFALYHVFGPNLNGVWNPGGPEILDPPPRDAEDEIAYMFNLSNHLDLDGRQMYLQVDRDAVNQGVRQTFQALGYLFTLYNMPGEIGIDPPMIQNLLSPYRILNKKGERSKDLEMQHQTVIDTRRHQFKVQVEDEGISLIYCDLFPRFGFSMLCFDPAHGHELGDVHYYHEGVKLFVEDMKGSTFAHPHKLPLLLACEYFQEYVLEGMDAQGGKGGRNYLGRYNDEGSYLNYINTATVPMLRTIYGEEVMMGHIPPYWCLDSIMLWEEMFNLCDAYADLFDRQVEEVWADLHLMTRAQIGYFTLISKPVHYDQNAEGSFWMNPAFNFSMYVHRDLRVWDQEDFKNLFKQAAGLHKKTDIAPILNNGKLLKPLDLTAAGSYLTVMDSRMLGKFHPEWTVPLDSEATPHVLHMAYSTEEDALVPLYNRMMDEEAYEITLSLIALELPIHIGTQYAVYQGDWDEGAKAFVDTYLFTLDMGQQEMVVNGDLPEGAFRYYFVKKI